MRLSEVIFHQYRDQNRETKEDWGFLERDTAQGTYHHRLMVYDG